MPCPRFVCAVNPEKKAGKLAICNNTITLQNPYDVDVCFKIKTTAPKRYQVKPNAKRIAAHSSLSITGAAPLASDTFSLRQAQTSQKALLKASRAETPTG